MTRFASPRVNPRWSSTLHNLVAKSLILRGKTSYKSMTYVRSFKNTPLQVIDFKQIFVVFFLL